MRPRELPFFSLSSFPHCRHSLGARDSQCRFAVRATDVLRIEIAVALRANNGWPKSRQWAPKYRYTSYTQHCASLGSFLLGHMPGDDDDLLHNLSHHVVAPAISCLRDGIASSLTLLGVRFPRSRPSPIRFRFLFLRSRPKYLHSTRGARIAGFRVSAAIIPTHVLVSIRLGQAVRAKEILWGLVALSGPLILFSDLSLRGS